MQILRLKIGKYKILENFKIEFKDNISVFIGENGSGKSTILEALLLIFRAAHLQFVEGKEEEFNGKIGRPLFVEVEYQINLKSQDILAPNKSVILILKGDENDKFRLETSSDESINDLIKDYGYEKLLPQKIIAYYAGWLERMETFCKKHQEIYIEKARKFSTASSTAFLKPLYIQYLRKEDFDIMLACFAAFEQKISIQKFFEEDLSIKIQDHFAVKIKFKSGFLSDFSEIQGQPRNFLNILNEYYSENLVHVPSEILCFTHENWIKIKIKLGNEKELFNNLMILSRLGFLDYVLTAFNKIGSSSELHQNFLSEGEQQRLTIMGIHEFMADENALILLDEPDVFLHPKWQRDFIYELSKDERPSNHYFITSHSPNILSGLKKEQVFALRKTENSTKIRNIHFNSYGKPVNEILTDFFDVESLRYKTAQDKIDRVWELIKSNKYKEDVFQTEFEALEKMIGKDDSEIISIKIELIRREKRNEKN